MKKKKSEKLKFTMNPFLLKSIPWAHPASAEMARILNGMIYHWPLHSNLK